MNSHENQEQVKRRRVFYIPGYDPIHPRRYRELYRSEGATQSALSGYQISVSAKMGDGPFGWHVHSDQDGTEVETQIQVLVWSDIVKDSMSNSVVATYVQLVRTAWIYLASGTFGRLMRLRKGPVIAALYPLAMLVFQLAVALAIAWGIWKGGSQFFDLFAIAPAILTFCLLLRWFQKIDNKLFAYYLMHDYAYSASLKGETPAALRRRMTEFTELIRQALATDVDEVLVVGHSSGAHIGVSVLADVIRSAPDTGFRPALSFLSLGQVVPMVSFLPNAKELRTDLQFLSVQYNLTWVDVSAPGDGCSFALCDPVGVSGVATESKKWPLVLSAAFTQTLSPERWQALRWRFFRLHFQYLCAFDRVGAYDYFRITAGPQSLAQRFRGRSSSKSRIDIAVSKHRTVML